MELPIYNGAWDDMGPIVLQQIQEQIENAEAVTTDAARLAAYQALRQIVAWLRLGEAGEGNQ